MTLVKPRGEDDMEIVIGVVVLVGLAALVVTQVAARGRLDVDVPCPRSESDRVVDEYFSRIWSRVPGPGTYNFRPKLRTKAPTISVTVRGSESMSHVSVWTSEFETTYGGMHHAVLMWRKKRGLAKRLLSCQNQPVPVP
jgi:hypothetical protein